MSDESSQRHGMAERIRTFDWSTTALGPRDSWSQRLRLMVEQVLSSPLVTTLVCGPDRLLIYNDSAALLFGDNHPSALGRPLPSAFAAGWETVAPFYERAFAGEVVTVHGQPLDTRGEGPQTEIFDALLMPVKEADGHVAHVHMTGFDIAGRQRDESVLRDSEDRLRTMLDSIAQATWETDATGVVIADSPSWRAYTGQSLEEWLGYGWLDAIHVEDRAYAERQWREAMAARRDVNAEFRLRLPDGGWRWTNVRAVPSLDDEGRVRKWMGVNIDIDARKEAERRQAFLLRLSDAMRSSADSAGLERDAVHVLAAELRADRVFLATIEPDGASWSIRQAPTDGDPLGSTCFPMSGFQRAQLPQWEAGRMSSVADSQTDVAFTVSDRAAYAALGVRAAIGVPLVRSGRFAALLCVNQATPRTWTKAEMSLASEAAERIWAAVERVQAEEALRESEDRLRDVLDSMAEGFALLDANLVILDVNRETLRLDGRSRNELVGRSHWDAFSSTHGSPVGEVFREVVRTQAPGSIEHLYAWPDGRQRWLEMRVYPTRDGSIAVFWRDVTDRRDAEDALRRSEEKYRALFDSMDEAYAVVDVLRNAAGDWADFRFVDVNPAFMKHTTMPYPVGRTATEALGSPNPRWAQLYGRAIDTDQPLRLKESEATLGRTFDLNIFTLDQAKARVAILFTDITERERIASDLRESEQRQRLLLEGMPQLVWRAVDEGRWTWASSQWIAHTGLSDEASKGFGWLEALHSDDRQAARAAWAHAAFDGIFEVECRIRNGQSGLYRWFQTRGMPIGRNDGSVAEWLGTCTDIDEQVRAQEFLRQAGVELEQRVAERTAELQQALETLQREVREHEQAEERLRQSEKLKAVGQLTGGIAHDFNNMLQGITSALALVEARLGQGQVEAARGYIEPAQKAATRAGALTHRLLAFSSQQTLSPRSVSLDHVARDMEDLVRRTVGPAVQVEVKSSDGPWRVLCDANQMESALLNLCINARDAMPEGGWLTIGIEDRMLSAADLAGFEELSPGRFVMLSVTDTGTGMPPEVLARAFEPFFTTKSPGRGTGLGLSQIYGFIRQSGGLVQIDTAPGKGTTVRLGLPAQETAVEGTRVAPTKGKTLLLVEDEHDLRRMLAVQLRDIGYGVLEADTADAALRVLNTGTHVDLLVTDVGLRGSGNGRQLAEAARTLVSELPVILVTGFPGDSVEGADRVLQKPFKFSMLALLIQEQIG